MTLVSIGSVGMFEVENFTALKREKVDSGKWTWIKAFFQWRKVTKNNKMNLENTRINNLKNNIHGSKINISHAQGHLWVTTPDGTVLSSCNCVWCSVTGKSIDNYNNETKDSMSDVFESDQVSPPLNDKPSKTNLNRRPNFKSRFNTILPNLSELNSVFRSGGCFRSFSQDRFRRKRFDQGNINIYNKHIINSEEDLRTSGKSEQKCVTFQCNPVITHSISSDSLRAASPEIMYMKRYSVPDESFTRNSSQPSRFPFGKNKNNNNSENKKKDTSPRNSLKSCSSPSKNSTMNLMMLTKHVFSDVLPTVYWTELVSISFIIYVSFKYLDY